MGHRAVCRCVGHEDTLLGIEDLCALSHKLDARKDNGAAVELGRDLAQVKRVAYIIRYVLYLGGYVVMRENHRVLFFFESIYLI